MSPSTGPAEMRRAHRRPTSITPARRCAFAVIRRVFEEEAYADRALHAEAQRAGLEPRERAQTVAMAYGTVQRRGTIDHLLRGLLDRPPEGLDAEVLAALRLGAFQLLFLDGVAEHAAVQQSVELAKRSGHRGGHRLVNAVLRRLAREGRAELARLDDRTPAAAAVRHSLPRWLAERWWDELGEDAARALMAAVNEPAETALRANTLRVTRTELLGALRARGVRARPGAWPEESIVVDGRFDVVGSELFARGAYLPQSRGAMLAAHLLDPQPGERVLDLCAAPGGKTTHIAARMRATGEIDAIERHPRRARALAVACERMLGADAPVTVHVADAATFAGRGYDRVLVDPPCSNLGTLRSRPDARWRASPERIAAVAAEQVRILNAAAAALGPGGVLVYATCTISMRENADQIDALLRRREDLVADDLLRDHPALAHPARDRDLQLLPNRDLTDGFYLARVRRTA